MLWIPFSTFEEKALFLNRAICFKGESGLVSICIEVAALMLLEPLVLSVQVLSGQVELHQTELLSGDLKLSWRQGGVGGCILSISPVMELVWE